MGRFTKLFPVFCGAIALSFPLAAQDSNAFLQRLDAMTVKEARELLQRMTDSAEGTTCRSVTHWMVRGVDKEDSTFVVVRCAGGADYNLMVRKSLNAEVRVLGCDMMRLLDLGCWGPIED